MRKFAFRLVMAILLVIVVWMGWQSFLRPGRQNLTGKPSGPVDTPSIVNILRVRNLSPYLNPGSSAWSGAPSTELSLIPQVMMVPWGTADKTLDVQAVSDNKKIIFQLSWPDATANKTLIHNGEFADGAAIMLPIKNAAPSSIMMGFMEPVNIWHWKSVRKYTPAPAYSDFHIRHDRGTLLATNRYDVTPTLAGSEIIDHKAVMPASLQEKKIQTVYGKSQWLDGRWAVVFSRDLRTLREEDSQFDFEKPLWAGFALWDGAKKERGSRKSISDWVKLEFGDGRTAHE